MARYYFSVQLGDNRHLCLAPLTDRKLASSGQEISDASGYFLYEASGSGDDVEIEIIAKAVSQDAAFRLRDMLKME